MIGFANEKVTAGHLARKAFLYVRQSTLRQVLEHTESTHRQYELRRRAVALGWSEERVEVIDSDLGQSGASSDDREGFKRLVAEVGMGHAGLVMGLEVSRLARNSSDWHRLLEISALTGTLILDEDGLYDPSSFNDRLVLGLKGTMSEAELHQIRARLTGGMLSKARRGELRFRLPVGFVYDAKGDAVLDPDKELQESVRLLFAEFRRTGSGHGAARGFREKGLLFPTRLHEGPKKGELVWRPLTAGRVFGVLADVTLGKGEEVTIDVRFRGGATRSLTVPRPRLPWEDRRVSPEVVREIDRLLAGHTHAEIAAVLNDAGHVSGTGKTFHADRVSKVVKAYRLKTRYARLREAGYLTLTETAKKLGVCRATVKLRRAEGRLGIRAVRLDDVGRCLYEDPEKTPLGAGKLPR